MSGHSSPRVALIHATPISMKPGSLALAEGFPEAQAWNLLDDRLMADAEEAGGLTPGLAGRMRSMIDYALASADAVLLACSLYGRVAVAAREAGLPVLASDEALFDEVGRLVPRTVLLVGHVQTAVDDSVARLREHLSAAGIQRAEVRGVAVAGLAEACTAGEEQRAASLIAAAVGPGRDADVLTLGMFSLSAARRATEELLGRPVLSPALMAAARLREQCATERASARHGE